MIQPPLGSITIENFWDMPLKELTIRRGSIDAADIRGIKSFYDIEDEQVLHDAELFVITESDKFYWGVNIITAADTTWDSGELMLCKINKDDNWKVTIGVNGRSQSMYIAPASSSSKSCSKRMYRIK